MDKQVAAELTHDGVTKAHLGNAAATINDLEKNGIGPQGVSQAALSEITREGVAQGINQTDIVNDTDVDYSTTDLNQEDAAGDVTGDDTEADDEDFGDDTEADDEDFGE